MAARFTSQNCHEFCQCESENVFSLYVENYGEIFDQNHDSMTFRSEILCRLGISLTCEMNLFAILLIESVI
ncbi:hypothetical protein EYF80_011326 [Liparis tanakae]|uniref:Uncharacterized protein n=1 Tax=Liparis tanakae TaxID=230148 RepID=A0A4Z2IMB6_9TELE|nr:hypothetical protein EYF80_011326 [Liparis tanakae]